MYRIHARDAPSINVRKRSSCMECCFYTEGVITVVLVCNVRDRQSAHVLVV